MPWTRPNLTAGARLLAERTDAFLDQIESLTDPNWATYAGALTAVTTNPTLGNSTTKWRYRQPAGPADLVHVEHQLVIGSTFTAGNGVYRWSMPVNASADSLACACGIAYIFDNGTANRIGVVKFETAGVVNIFRNDQASAMTNAGPGTAWATGDIVAFSIAYEPA